MTKQSIKKYLSICLIISAFAFATAAFAEPPADAKLQYNMGVDMYKVGKYDQAMSSFRRAIDLYPDYTDAYYNLGSILEFLGQYDQALTVFKQVIVRNPEDYESVYKAAALSVKLGQSDKARTYLSLIPNSTTTYRKAQELAAQIGTDMPAIQFESQKTIDMETAPQTPQSNQVYDNIISPTGITSDRQGNIYIAGFSDNSVIKITPTGERIIFLKDKRLNGPIGMVTDNSGNIYIANYNADNVLKVSNTGSVSILIGNISKPYGLYVDGNFLYISSQGMNSVIKYKL